MAIKKNQLTTHEDQQKLLVIAGENAKGFSHLRQLAVSYEAEQAWRIPIFGALDEMKLVTYIDKELIPS